MRNTKPTAPHRHARRRMDARSNVGFVGFAVCALIALLAWAAFANALAQPLAGPAQPGQPPQPGQPGPPAEFGQGDPQREPDQGFGDPERMGPGQRRGRRDGGMADEMLRRAFDPATMPQRIVQIDQEMQIMRQRYAANEQRRLQLLDTLTATKKEMQAGELSPSAIVQRRNLDTQLDALHALTGEDQHNTMMAARLGQLMVRMREHWEPLFSEDADANAVPGLSAESRTRWEQASAALQGGDKPAYFVALFGEAFGPRVAQQSGRLRGPGMRGGGGPDGPRGLGDGPPPLDGPPPPADDDGMPGGPPQDMPPMDPLDEAGELELPEGARSHLLMRLTRMEQRQGELKKEVERQQGEIMRMRRFVERKGKDLVKDADKDSGENGGKLKP